MPWNDNDLKFEVLFVTDSATFEVGLASDNQNIEVGFDHLQVITQKPEEIPVYEGSYEITPAIEAQTLETKNRKMEEDLKVLEIPYFETSNPSGTTVIIGG